GQGSDDQDQPERDEQDEETLDAILLFLLVAGGLRRRAHLSSLDSKTTRWASFHPRLTVLSSSGSSSPRKNIRMPSAQSRVRCWSSVSMSNSPLAFSVSGSTSSGVPMNSKCIQSCVVS